MGDACRTCETISAAPIPPAVIDGGMAAPGLLTWVMIGKFLDHLPLYRLEQIAARQQPVEHQGTFDLGSQHRLGAGEGLFGQGA